MLCCYNHMAALYQHGRWHVYSAAVAVTVLKTSALVRAFQGCGAHGQRTSMHTRMHKGMVAGTILASAMPTLIRLQFRCRILCLGLLSPYLHPHLAMLDGFAALLQTKDCS